MKIKSSLWLIHLVVTLIIIGVYLCIAPYLKFPYSQYFTSPLAQFIFSTTLVLIWVACHLRRKKQNDNEVLPVGEEKEAVSEVTVIPLKTWRKHFAGIEDTPIVFVIGEAGSGKTTLLSLLGEPIQRLDYEKSQWSLFQEAIAIEVAMPLSLESWVNLLAKLKPYKKKLIAAIYCFSVHHAKNNLENSFAPVSQQLIEFERCLKRSISVYFVLNQIDRLTGFSLFSQHLDDTQKDQMFFIGSKKVEIKEWFEDVNRQLKEQVSNFQEQRLLQLELHPTVNEHYKLYEFSEKFRYVTHYLRKGLANLLSKWNGFSAIRGLFFSSLVHGDARKNFFMDLFWPYVLEQPKQDSLLSTEYLKQYSYKIKISFYCALAAAFLFFIVFWSRNFFIATSLLDEMRDELAVSSSLTFSQLGVWKKKLDFQSKLAPILRIDRSLEYAVDALYNQRLEEISNNIFNEWFHKHLAENAGIELYKNLRAYLMLGDLKHRDVNTLNTWLMENPTAIAPQFFNSYINNKLVLQLDPVLIDNVRQNLMSLSGPQISYLLFLDSEQKTKVDQALFTMDEFKQISRFFYLQPSAFVIPSVYTRSWLLDQYDVVFSNVYKDFLQMNWVVNPQFYSRSEDVVKQYKVILQFYLNEYLDVWKNHFLNLKLVKFSSLTEISQALNELSQPDSALDILLYKLDANTSFVFNKTEFLEELQLIKNAKNMNIIRAYLNPTFGAMDQFMQAQSKPTDLGYANIKTMLQSVAQELIQLNSKTEKNQILKELLRMSEPNAQQNAFQMLEQTLISVPQPLQGWLQQLCDQIWTLLMQEALQQLESVWQQTVMSFYNLALNDKFPINPQAKTNISIEDFNHFYAPNGVVEQFYQQYLKSFIAQFVPNGLLEDATSANTYLSASMLQVLKQAKLIQNAFFNNASSNKMAIDFYIEPYDLSPDVAQVKLVINGQPLVYGHGPREFIHFVWPKADPLTALIWTDLSGREYSYTTQSPWGFFQLLQQASVRRVNGDFLVTFHRDNFSATFILKSTGAYDPFAVFLNF